MTPLLQLLAVAALLVGFAVLWRSMRTRSTRAEALAAARGALADELILSAEEERRRLAGVLHDGPVQQLMLARASLADATGAGVSTQRARAAEAAIGDAIDQLRGRMQDLHSHVLEFAGLEAALESEAARAAPAGTGVEITVEPAAAGLTDELLFAVARELLLNAVRHAHGTRVTVDVFRRADAVGLRVRDDGGGFDEQRRLASLRAGHVGLASSTHRVEAAGGRFSVSSGAGGTDITVMLPVGRSVRHGHGRPIEVLPKSAR